MKSRWMQAAALLALAGLVSCGGGGGGGGGSGAAPTAGSGTGATGGTGTAASVPAAFLGSFMGPCFESPLVVTADGDRVRSRTYLTVAAPSGNVARLSLRIDFHTDPVCATSPAGYLSFDDPANRVVFDGPGTVQGKVVQRVTYAVAAPAGGVRVPGDRVEFGGAIRLRALSMLFSPIDLRSLWLVENGKLYEGTSVMGPDGYPSDMDMSVGADFVASVPPMVAACAATAVNWGTDSCGSSLPAAVSGTSRLLADISGPATGSATYTCQSGTWTRGTSTCSAAPAPVAAPADCSTSPVTWTVNGLSCTGEALAVAELTSSLVPNTDPTRRGFAQFTCTAGQQVATAAECGLPLPLPPDSTDPATIAVAKNCTVCHSARAAASSVNGVSFQVIADRYRTSPPAAGVLESRVKLGSVGTFGSVPMPANPQITDAELAIVIPWILRH